MKKYHMSIDIRGVLNWNGNRLKSLFRNKDGSKATLHEIKEFLYDKLSDGYEYLPINGVECEGFDRKKGCPGHETNSSTKN